MNINTIRETFITYFQKKEHTQLPHAPLVNHQDPNLLFTIAGMNPFKDILLGQETPKHQQVVTSQPCLRVTGKHNDLEEVGLDTYHHTLFEMLGNWSFGSYFKQQAIASAYDLLTNHYNIDPTTLYATVFQGDPTQALPADKESLQLWKNYLPPSHILYGTKKDNFWEMGSTGPCGPCTEIHIDLRTKKEKQQTPGAQLVNTNHPQVIELWNLVFMQYNQHNNTRTPLPQQHVDTGMGLERLAMVLQHKQSTYQTDAFNTIIHAINHITATKNNNQTALRVIADHIRAATFAIAEGAHPSNQKQGYVIRRILRRALRYGYTHLNLTQPFLHQLVPHVINTLHKAYPTLPQQQDLIQQSIHQEETTFINTLAQGISKFTHIIKHLPHNTTTLNGNIAFQLYDTYGFPPDLTALMAREKGLTIDTQAFNKAMQQQKHKSQHTHAKPHHNTPWHTLTHTPHTTSFIGYDTLQTTTHITKYRQIQQNNKTLYQIVLQQTPFYPEGGGQIGDIGHITTPTQTIKILDTKKINQDIIHYTTSLPTDPHAPLTCKVDHQHRASTSKNHTATHLLLHTMRHLLGTHITQQGSLVHNKGLRLDFTHHQKLTQQQLRTIEEHVNKKIRNNLPLQEQRNMPIQQAKKIGATATFTEKYGDTVRVVQYGNNHIDLCGGTHVQSTGAIGLFKIQAEKSVCTGVRRIEAITGLQTEKWVQQQQDTLIALGKQLKNTQDPLKGATQLITKHKKLNQQLDQLTHKILQQQLQHILTTMKKTHNTHIAITQIDLHNTQALKKIALSLAKTHQPLILILATHIADQAHLLTYITPTLTTQYQAHNIIQTIAKHIHGKGGGTPHLAMATGPHIQGIAKALQTAQALLNPRTT